MSADTFMWVAEFPDGWRITGVEQAPDNLEYDKEYYKSKGEFINMVREYFWDSEVYDTSFEAYKAHTAAYDDYFKDEEDERGLFLEHWTLSYKFDFTI